MITIEIREANRCNCELGLFITFPYDAQVVDTIRALPNRFWDNDNKCWETPFNKLGVILESLPDYEIEIKADDATIFAPKRTNKVDYKFKTTPFQHQIEGFQYGMENDKWLLGDEQGLGKALALDTKIYTYPNGYKLMKDIEVGDYVFGKNGMPTKVTNTYYHKNVEMYRFTFSDGVSIDCCKDHLWEINDQHGKKVVDTNWFLQKNQFGVIRKDNLCSKYGYNYYIDRCNPIQFKSISIDIDPYVLGALLGDGCLSGGSISFTTIDDELVNRINSKLPDGYILHSSDSMENITYNIVRTEHTVTPNIVKQSIKQLGLLNTNSHTKFIPDVYKYNSVDVRLAVLQGLIDTDGYATKENLLTYTSVSKQLCEDVRFLVESLGGICNLIEGDCGYNGKVTGKSYTLTIRFDDPSMFCTLNRKKTLLKPRHFKPRRNIVSIERIENADAKCITVDSIDHLYLAEHCVVTHNTKQVIDIAVAKKLERGYEHCLIICGVNGLKWNWQSEIATHSDETGWILGQKTTRNGKLKIGSTQDKINDLENLPDAYFLITNIESLRDVKLAAKLVELCKNNVIGLVAADECHKMKNPTSQQGKAFLKVQAKTMIAMTGTPLMNTPMDLFIILKWLGYEDHTFSSFKNYYCILGGYGGYQVMGYRHLDQLSAKLNDVMLRRLKDDVLDLPDKTLINEYVEMSGAQEQLYKEVNNNIKANVDMIKMSPNPLAEMIRLRQVTGYTGILSSSIQESAKLDRMVELVSDALSNNKKVVIFSNWTSMTDAIDERLAKTLDSNGVALSAYTTTITGEVADADRQARVNAFQTKDDIKIIVGTIGAMGTGLTLTSGTVEIFLDEPWTMAAKEQAMDRCHRIGQHNNVTVYTLITKNTIDERINEIVCKKGAMADAMVDGNYVGDREALVDFLLS